MDSIVRGLVFRISGRRTLSNATTFDLVLLLIISEVTQQAMVNDDHSLTNSLLLILTLVMTTLGLSELKQHFPQLKYILEGSAVMIVRNGKMLPERMKELRVDKDEILEAARAAQGLESLEGIKYAFVEPNGEITFVAKQK